ADRHPPAVSFRPHLWGQVESPEGRSLLVGVTAMRQRLFRQAMSLAALLVPLASPARGQETANGSHRPDSKVVITAVGIVGPSSPKTPAANILTPLRLNDILRLLQGTIDTHEFQSGMRLDQALARLSGLCKAQGKELVFVVDREAFKEENPDAPDVHAT